MNVYAGAADNLDILSKKSEETEAGYKAFIDEMSNEAASLEAKIQNNSMLYRSNYMDNSFEIWYSIFC